MPRSNRASPGPRAAWALAVLLLAAIAAPPALPQAESPRPATVEALPPEGLVGGIGLTELTVYDQRPAPDGLMSGSPHIHAVTDEAYYVLSGRGRVELHDLASGFRSVDLRPGLYLQFPPGTLHRLVSDGRLVILAVMGNAGLAERGDARIYFGRAVDDDPAEYARLVGLARARGLEGALDRRDAAIRAYVKLLDLWSKDRKAYFRELARFIGVHRKAAARLRPSLLEAVGTGPLAWGEYGRRRVAALPEAVPEDGPALHLPPGTQTLGMCGLLRPVTSLKIVGAAAGPDARR
jgi:mannose-6-phosphate isomerase-like protein (cupin superfamily)